MERFLIQYSIVFVTMFAAILLPFSAVMAQDQSATLAVDAEKDSYEVGEEALIRLFLSSSQAATAFQANLSYDPELFTVVEVINNSEEFPHWFVKDSVRPGAIELAAGSPAPGFQGEALLATVRFVVQQPGNASIAFEPSSVVLNSQDENILDLSSSEAVSLSLSGEASSGAINQNQQESGGMTVDMGVLALIGVGVLSLGVGTFLLMRRRMATAA